MKVEIKRNNLQLTEFSFLSLGDPFLFDGELWMKATANFADSGAVRLSDGRFSFWEKRCRVQRVDAVVNAQVKHE